MNISGIKNVSPTPVAAQTNLALSVGQAISAQIVKAEGSQILLQYGAYLFKAKTDLPLKSGEQLKLTVQSIDNNIVNLKIVSEKANQPSSAITALLAPGQSSDPNLEKIARQLTKFNLPVSLSLLSDINKLIKKHQLPADISQLLVWLRAVGIEVDSEPDLKALQLLHKFFLGELNSEGENARDARCFTLLNETENQFAGGLNIFGWPLSNHHIYLLQEGAKNQAAPPEQCRLALKVDSAAFQQLWFFLDFTHAPTTVTVYCQDEKSKNILQKEIISFKAALEEAGYRIAEVTVKVDAYKSTIFDFLPEKEISNININI